MHIKSVFFLDDDVDYLELAQLYVEGTCDCTALTSQSYNATLANEVSILQTDMAFLDINLGAGVPSGIEVYRWLRTKGYDKPVYFLTGHAENSPEALEVQALGGVKVLCKPFPHRELKSLIGNTP